MQWVWCPAKVAAKLSVAAAGGWLGGYAWLYRGATGPGGAAEATGEVTWAIVTCAAHRGQVGGVTRVWVRESALGE